MIDLEDGEQKTNQRIKIILYRKINIIVIEVFIEGKIEGKNFDSPSPHFLLTLIKEVKCFL